MPDFTYDGTVTLSCTVRNLDAATAWFKDKLGFDQVFRVPGWAEVATPAEGVTIGLAEDEETSGSGGGTTPVFGVADIDAARGELEAKGVAFEGETIELPGMVKLAAFASPEGNRYMLAQSLAEQP